MKHKVTEIQLKNGARGLLVDVPGATVTTYELNFRAGEFLVPRKKWEVPHLLEHVIASGSNETYPDRNIFQAEISKNGADLNAYTSYYYVAYVGEIADFEWDRVLKLQLESISRPLFMHHEFEAEFGNIRDELIALSNNHFRILDETLTKSFGLNVATDKERERLMKNIVREDLIDHYHKTHFSRNLRFIIAGDMRGRRADIKKMIEEAQLTKGSAHIKLPTEKAKKPSKTVFIPNDTIENIYLIVSTYHNDLLNQRDEDALGVARIMLTETLYSKIFGQARDKGLVYHVGSSHHQAYKYTEWFLRTQVLPQNAPELCDIILTEVKKVQNSQIDGGELEGAKQYALGSFQRSLQTVGSISSSYSRYFFDGHVEDIKSIPNRIKAITKQDVARAMRLMFAENIGSVGVLGGTDPSVSHQIYEQLQPLWRI
jgi:predicted Zn-dependent peptidase